MPATFNFADPIVAASACHEAGHCIAAFLVGLPVESAVLYDRHSGVVKHPDGLHHQFDWDDWERLSAAVGLAGPVSECFYRRTQRHSLAMAKLKSESQFWAFALLLPTPRGFNVDLERVARYCRQGARPARYQRQRARKLFTKVHTAITNVDVWSIVRDVAERLAHRGVLIDDELQPFRARSASAGQRWRLLQNV
jgi:YD repeat-containing protein